MNDNVKQFLEIYEKCDLFFKEALEEAIKHQHVELSEEAAAYLLWILHLASKDDPHFNPEATIQRYLNAFSGKGPETFRVIGDSSLMLAGIWPESLTRKLVGVDYYIKLGSVSYEQEAHRSIGLYGLFKELSRSFVKSVSILMEATHLLFKRELTDKDILHMYQRWQETHSEFLEKELRKLGVNPIMLKPGKH